jgi:methionyl-tRNA formyltransferase
MRIAVLGTVDAPLLGHLLAELFAARITVTAVILDAKGQNSRDHALHEERTAGRMPPVPLEAFEDAHVPFYFVADHRSAATVRLLQALSVDLLVNGGTPRILPRHVLDAVSVGVLNCHPGLLPRFRGCTCVEWAVYLDEPVGNTVHFMDERIDEGPIVVQEPIAFSPQDRYVDVRIKVYDHGHKLMARAVRTIVDKQISRASLPPQGPGTYFGVIEEDKMRMVVDKLARGAYRFQR